MSYSIREMRKEEYSLLSDFLYEAIYIPDGTAAPPKSVITCPELQVYIADFGNSKHDKALIVEVDGNIVGAIWARIMNDYGHIDENTPSLVAYTNVVSRKSCWLCKDFLICSKGQLCSEVISKSGLYNGQRND